MDDQGIKITLELVDFIIKMSHNPDLALIFAKCEIKNEFFYLRNEPINNPIDFDFNQN
jgi:hypothetical protein